MAVCGLPDDTKTCPDCHQTMVYSAALRGYSHVLALGCPAFGATWKHGETVSRPEKVS